jgi:hypothetical protein
MSARDSVSIGAADAAIRLGRDAARSHRTDAAAYARLSEFALWLLLLLALLPRFRSGLACHFAEFGGICFELLDGCEI